MTLARRQFVQGIAAGGALAATSAPLFAQSAPIANSWPSMHRPTPAWTTISTRQ